MWRTGRWRRTTAPTHVVAVHDMHAATTSQIRCRRRPKLELQDDKDDLYSAPLRSGEGGRRRARADGGHRGQAAPHSSAARGGAVVFDQRRMQLSMPLISAGAGALLPLLLEAARRRRSSCSTGEEGRRAHPTMVLEPGRSSGREQDLEHTEGRILRRSIEPGALAIAAAPPRCYWSWS
jgi:hypothetical protein